jgi:hypothetical protein
MRPTKTNAADDVLAGFGHIPLLRRDLTPFGTEVGTNGRAIWAIHRDAAGRETGRETIYGGGGRGGFSFTPGGSKSMFRVPGPCRPRLVLVDGPIQAISLAALDGAAANAVTTYAAPGGTWTDAATAALLALVQAGDPVQVILAFATGSDGGCRSRDVSWQAISSALRTPIPIRPIAPPAGGWAQALHMARQRRSAA